MLIRQGTRLFTCFGILFNVPATQWVGIFFQTGTAPHQATISAFNGVHVHVGLWWADLLITPIIWTLMLYRFALPLPWQWDGCTDKERRTFRIHLLAALVAGIAASVAIAGSFFPFEAVLMVALMIASSGVFWAMARGALAGRSPGPEGWTPDLARGSMGIVISVPIALFCGSFAGLATLIAFGIVYGTVFWVAYGVAALWRFFRSLRIPRTVA